LQEFNYYGHFLALDLESFGIIGWFSDGLIQSW
jgi:hypothetical protein